MRVLSIDTALPWGAVAITVAGQPLVEIGALRRTRHAETLLPTVEAALEAAELRLDELDLVAVGLGPGGFTSLRVGIATAKGLCVARQLPLIGVPTLLTLVRGLGPSEGAVRAAMTDAGRDQVYLAAYGFGADPEELLPPRLASIAEAVAALEALPPEVSVRLCGAAATVHAETLRSQLGDRLQIAGPSFDVPRAAVLAAEAERRFDARGPDDLAALEPLYVRSTDAKLPSRPLRSDLPPTKP